MSLKKMTDEQVYKLMIDHPLLSRRQMFQQFGVSNNNWTSTYRSHKEEIEKLRENILKNSEPDLPKDSDSRKWIYNKNYVYNKDNDTYVTFLPRVPKPIVVDGETHRAMQKAYSDWDGNPSTINEICRTFSFPRAWFIKYKQIHEWTHDKEPFTSEELMETPVDDLVADALQARRNVLFQRYEQEKWKQTKEDADNWRKLIHKEITPFNTSIEQWKPLPPFKLPKSSDVNEDFYFVASANDWHIGLKAIEENLMFGKDWNIDIARKVIEDYLSQIYHDVQRFNVNWKGCILFNLGDIAHGMRGLTERGTRLITDATKKQQYDVTLDLLTYYIEGLQRIFGTVEEEDLMGNHDGFDFYALMKNLQARYINRPEIRIKANGKGLAWRKVGKTLFVLAHGQDAFGMKSIIPVRDGEARRAQVQELIMQAVKELIATDPKGAAEIIQYVFIQGHFHFYKQIEKGFFEDLQFGSPELGDDYADALRLNSRPSQSALVVSSTQGIRSVWRYYFDTKNFKS